MMDLWDGILVAKWKEEKNGEMGGKWENAGRCGKYKPDSSLNCPSGNTMLLL